MKKNSNSQKIPMGREKTNCDKTQTVAKFKFKHN